MPRSRLHDQLKSLYAGPGGKTEVAIDGFVIDAVRGGCLYEVQTRTLSALRSKLKRLAKRHSIVVICPIAKIRQIVTLAERDGEVLRSRQSPKKGSFSDIFLELVGMAGTLPHPKIELELLLTEERELRIDDGRGSWRRRGVSVAGHELVEILDRLRLRHADDYLGLIPELPGRGPFTTADLARCLGKPRWLAQKAAYFLNKAGLLRAVERRREGVYYEVASN
jgi:hypothetical protein